VTPDDLLEPATQRLIDDMIETMRDADGIGLAAPQVFVSRRLAILEVRPNPRYPAAPRFPLTILANPEVEPLTGDQIEAWESCLSLDDLRGKVRRPAAVLVRYLDRYGEPKEAEFEGFSAVVVQHETDHLQGKLFVDRMSDMSTLTHMREWERHWQVDPAMVAD
jgi:peptide deformylase